MLYYGLEFHSLDSYFQFKEITTPSTPQPNEIRLFAEDAAGISTLCYKNDAGTKICLPTSGVIIGDAVGGAGDGVDNQLAIWNGDSAIDAFALTENNILFGGAGSIAAQSNAAKIVNPAGETALVLKGTPNSFVRIDGDAAGNPYLEFAQGATPRARIQYLDTGDALAISGGPSATERLRLTSSGALGHLVTVPKAEFHSHSTAALGSTRGAYFTNYNSDSAGPQLRLIKGRGTIGGATSVVLSGDQLGTLFFGGTRDTIDTEGLGAVIAATAGSNWSGSSTEGYLGLFTTPSGSLSFAERFRIGSAGQFGIGGANFGTAAQYFRSAGALAPPSWATILSTEVQAAVIGSPTFSTVQHFQDIYHSAGWVSGGTINDAGGGNITVDAGTGMIRATDSAVAQILFFDWAALGSTAIPSNTVRFIGVAYNAGSPVVEVRTTYNWDFNTDFALGTVVNEAGTLHIINNPHAVADHANNMIQRLYDTLPFARANRSGGLALGETGTRNVTVSSGTIWEKLNSFAISALDTSVSDTFDRYYRDGGGGWTKQASQTQWDNAQYDDGSGTLAALTGNFYSVQYFYIELDGELVSLYGQNQYSALADAEADTPPASTPDRLAQHGRLIGRIIFRNGGSAATAIQSVFTQVFGTSGAMSHDELSNLAWTLSGHTGTANRLAAFNGSGAASEIDHATDFLSQYALLAGRAGGQTLIGGTASGNSLTLQSTSNATRGDLVTDCADITMVAASRARMASQNRFRYLNSMASVYRSTVQSISDSTVTAISWDSEEVDTDGLHEGVTNPTRITIALTGKYFVFGQIDYEPNSSGTRQARIHKNGSEFITNVSTATATGITVMQVNAFMSLSAGDWLELAAFQDSSFSLNANSNIANAPTTRFNVMYLGE